MRNDVKELMEWGREDLFWFIELFKKNGVEVPGKFNGGQKGNFLLILLLITGLFLSGSVIWMRSMFSRSLVEFTFIVHDSLAMLSIILLTGHIILALYNIESLAAIVYGTVDTLWAEKHYPKWLLRNKSR